MIGELLAYFAGRASRPQRGGVSPPARPIDIVGMRLLAILFVICLVLILLAR